MVSVKVCWKQNGKPAEGRKVAVSFDGLTGGITGNEFTNSSGEVHFDVDPGQGKVYVDGNTAFTGWVQGMIVVYL